MTPGWELRERRRDAGLPLKAVARAAGTSTSNVSAYERGAKSPNASTLHRLTAVIEAGSSSPIHRHNLVTVPAAAAALRHAGREGWSTADRLRIVREMRANSKAATDDVDSRAAFFASPTTTGDQRWDAMVAGCVEELALRYDFAPPPWCLGHALPRFWFVGSSPGLAAYAFARSPFPLQVRGVMADPTDLESV